MSKTILITGAGGVIGTVLRHGLADAYTVRAHERRPIEGVETIVADINDLEAMRAACQGVDSVIHLAAQGYYLADWEDVARNNIQGTYSVFEAAKQAGVKQVIFASSNHAVGAHEWDHPDIYRTGRPVLDKNVEQRADSYYGVSKAVGETLGRYYADAYNLHVLCIRIGVIARDDKPPHNPFEPEGRLFAIWQSQRDFVQMVRKCLEAEHILFDIFYGSSNNSTCFYDLEYARNVLGYEPQDSADQHENVQAYLFTRTDRG